MFYPEASQTRCEAALVLDVDPVGLVRGKGQADGLLDQYVNDRPYAASSFLSVALNKAFRTAMTGVCSARQELADSDFPLEAVVTPLPMRGGEQLVRQLFEPLGWNVDRRSDRRSGGGTTSKLYARVKLTGRARLSALLNHLYVLIPVMDDAKHYWVGEDEIDKLLKRGEGWLEQHPAKELIVRRYLRHRRTLARAALERLAPETQDGGPRARGARCAGGCAGGADPAQRPTHGGSRRRRFVRPAPRPLPIWAAARASCCTVCSASDGPSG